MATENLAVPIRSSSSPEGLGEVVTDEADRRHHPGHPGRRRGATSGLPTGGDGQRRAPLPLQAHRGIGRPADGEISEAKLRGPPPRDGRQLPALYTTSIAADDLDEAGSAPGLHAGQRWAGLTGRSPLRRSPTRTRIASGRSCSSGSCPPRRASCSTSPPTPRPPWSTLAECAADAGCHALHPDPQSRAARLRLRSPERDHRRGLAAASADA